MKPPIGYDRTLVLALDSAQYQSDMNALTGDASEDVYTTFNVLLRRKPKGNNFKVRLMQDGG